MGPGRVVRRVVKRAWIPVVLVVVFAVSGLVVSRLHRVFGSEDLNANAGAGIEIVQFNPKVLVYEVYGPPGATAQISYFDPDANVHSLTAPLPWSITAIFWPAPRVSGHTDSRPRGFPGAMAVSAGDW